MLAALVEVDDEYEGCVTSDDSHSVGSSLISERAKMVNISLVVECCQAILRRVRHLVEQSTTADAADAGVESPDLDHFMFSLVEKEAILVESDGFGKRSFSKFCKVLENYLTEASEDELSRAFGGLLGNLTIEDYNLLLKVLIASGNASQCTKEGLTLLHLNNGPKQLTEVDIALFHLTNAKESIQTRLVRLENVAVESKTNALSAKGKGAKRLALSHMKRWKLFVEEAERCGNNLLNLEQMLESLRRSMDDRDTIRSYELCADAMKFIRLDESEGGLGLNLERVDQVKDDMVEELSINQEINAKLTAATGVESLTTSFSALTTSDDIAGIDDELELEYQKLEEEMKIEDARRSNESNQDNSALNFPSVPERKLPEVGVVTASKVPPAVPVKY
uniref:Uncharacterized protein n=2 Tax=Leptocylindrus danicus TaxID=163516 RepID=A0A7S2K5I7_9STRA|mmetsp:Transcript_18115/g.26929  ORF Transcript_18115/g.26929 Transcript_18115/m.26929 type:complete len:393 (+) Transcript_18115:244-1422(+)